MLNLLQCRARGRVTHENRGQLFGGVCMSAEEYVHPYQLGLGPNHIKIHIQNCIAKKKPTKIHIQNGIIPQNHIIFSYQKPHQNHQKNQNH